MAADAPADAAADADADAAADGAADAALAATDGAAALAAADAAVEAGADGAVDAVVPEQAAMSAGPTISPAPATTLRVRNARRPICVGSAAATGSLAGMDDPPPTSHGCSRGGTATRSTGLACRNASPHS